MGRIQELRKTIAGLSILGASLVASAAIAQDQVAPLSEGPTPVPEETPAAGPAPGPAAAPVWTPLGYPDAYVLRPLTVPPGMFQGTLPVVLNFSTNKALKPVWIPLDMRFGMTDQLEFFVSHNALGAPLAVGGGGLCLGKSQYCPHTYNNLNVGGQFSLAKSKGIEVSGLLAAEFRQFSPDLLFAVDVGVGVKYVSAVFSARATPRLGIGVNRRNAENEQEAIAVPIQLALQAAPRLAAFLDTGLFGPTNQFSSLYTIPVGVGADFLPRHGFDVGAEFMFRSLGQGSAVTGTATDSRTLMLYAVSRNP
ncbi:MAG: hypothetical protein WCG85_26605 [Polyangia bacterium]